MKTKKQFTNRILSIVLALVMVVGMLPMSSLTAFAAAVNGGNNAINGELTADIKVNANVLAADGTLNGDGSNFKAWTPSAMLPIGTPAPSMATERRLSWIPITSM